MDWNKVIDVPGVFVVTREINGRSVAITINPLCFAISIPRKDLEEYGEYKYTIKDALQQAIDTFN